MRKPKEPGLPEEQVMAALRGAFARTKRDGGEFCILCLADLPPEELRSSRLVWDQRGRPQPVCGECAGAEASNLRFVFPR